MKEPDNEHSDIPVVDLKGEDPAGIVETPRFDESALDVHASYIQEESGRASIFIQRRQGHKSEMEFRLEEFESIIVSYAGERFEIDLKLLFERLQVLKKSP